MTTADPPPRRRFLPEPVETSTRQSRRRIDDPEEQSQSSPSSTSSSAETTTDSILSSSRPNTTESSSTKTSFTVDDMAPAASMSSANTTSTITQSKPRRVLPQPVEETVRSSKKTNMENGAHTTDVGRGAVEVKPSEQKAGPSTPSTRRFAPEPVETSTRSSKKYTPDPLETTTRSSKDKEMYREESPTSKPKRRFAPEPVETSTRSHKSDKEEPNDTMTSKARRRFAPEPVETSSRSSKDKSEDQSAESRPKRKFLPQPVETTSTSSKRKSKTEPDDDDGDERQITRTPSRTSSGGRRFTPELLETAKGSFKQQSPGKERRESEDSNVSSRRSSNASESGDEVPELTESRFSAAALAKRHHQERKHSYIAPDLPIIESDSGSEASEAPSLSDSPSSTDTDPLQKLNNAKTNDSYTDYVLSLAAQTVDEKELQEQAMAAYINERPHEPVSHFAIDEEEDSTIKVGRLEAAAGVDVRVFRRSSQADLDWEMSNMRKHHAKLDAMKREFKADTAGYSRFSAAALACRHHIGAHKEEAERKAKKARENEDAELAKMRAAASPPMAGGDIVFPFSISPKMTRCDPDQIPRPRTDDKDDDTASDSGNALQLWASKTQAQSQSGAGLWMGMCQAPTTPPAHTETPIRSGLQTPAPERSLWGGHTPGRGHETPGGRRGMRGLTGGINWLQLTPSRRPADHVDSFIDTVDKKLRLAQQIEEEFPDRVITQIYNYLSLGYPALAYPFDDELSKISRIPVEDLRRDDEHADAKGYVGAPEGDGVDESEAVSRCKRWEALKLYVHEWARQSPNFADARQKAALGGTSTAMANWGMAARKGSWGN